MNASIPDRALAPLQATPETNAAFIAITGHLRCILRLICRPTAWLVRLCFRHWRPVMRVCGGKNYAQTNDANGSFNFASVRLWGGADLQGKSDMIPDENRTDISYCLSV